MTIADDFIENSKMQRKFSAKVGLELEGVPFLRQNLRIIQALPTLRKLPAKLFKILLNNNELFEEKNATFN